MLYTQANPFPRGATLALLWELASWRQLMDQMAAAIAAREGRVL